MNRKNFFKVLQSYFLINIKIIILFIIIVLTFLLVGFLYNINFDYLTYSLNLSLFIFFIYLALDFYKYLKNFLSLREIKDNIEVNLPEFNSSYNLIEEELKEIIALIYKDKTDIISKSDLSKTNLINYYTLWAHQIKTPISAMRLILQSEEFPQKRELEMELFKIEEYVEFVLQYIRIDSMNSDLTLEKYSLDEIVKEAIKKYSKIFIRKKIKLNFDSLNYTILTDKKWFSFVIEQLLSNALKYTKEGSISIYMDKKLKDTLVIEDTGIGINSEDIPRVFERGFTGFNGRLDKKSTGIGLYLCKEILSKLSHKIKIESKISFGTKIFIDLSRKDLKIE